MTWLLLFKNKFVQYLLLILAAFAVFFRFKKSVRDEAIEDTLEEVEENTKKFHIDEKAKAVEHEEDLRTLDDVELAKRVSKYTKKD